MYGVDALTSIATLGSHCSMQVLKGAKDEGFKTVLVCERKRQSLYSRFNFIDEMIMVDSFTEVAEKSCQNKLEDLDSILIPHGTLVSQLDSDKIESIKTPVFQQNDTAIRVYHVVLKSNQDLQACFDMISLQLL